MVNIPHGIRLKVEFPIVLIYINDLSENLASEPKLFPDDTSLFSVVKKC